MLDLVTTIPFQISFPPSRFTMVWSNLSTGDIVSWYQWNGKLIEQAKTHLGKWWKMHMCSIIPTSNTKTKCLKQSLWKGTQRGSFSNRLRIWKQIHLISITMLNLQAGQSVLKSHEVIDSAYSDLLRWSLLYLKLHSFTAAFKLKRITTKQNSARLWTEQINHVPWMHNDTLQIFNWIIQLFTFPALLRTRTQVITS